MDKEAGLQLVKELVNKFACNHTAYTESHSVYNETQLRVDFLDRFLAALGWDVFNDKQAPQHLREAVRRQVGDLYGITKTDLVAVGAILEGKAG